MVQETKIIHTGDLHLGMTFKSLGDKSKLHRRDCQEVFSDIVNLCIKEKVKLVPGKYSESLGRAKTDEERSQIHIWQRWGLIFMRKNMIWM